jgi:hypothetical protein
VNTRDPRTKKAIRRSLEIKGEVDGVTPRDKDKFNATVATLSKKGVNLTEDQLRSILNIITSPTDMSAAQASGNSNNALNNKSNQKKQQAEVEQLDLANYNNQNQRQQQQPGGGFNNGLDNDILRKSYSLEEIDKLVKTNKLLPSEAKRLKWQRDRELEQQVARQEEHDKDKFRTAKEEAVAESERQQNQANMNRSGMTPEPAFFKSTMTLAERKRAEWQEEKGTVKIYYFFYNYLTTLFDIYFD